MTAASPATAAWSLATMPDQSGRTAVVTGPSVGGLGQHVALELARRGARVVLAGRNPDKLGATADAIRAEAPGVELEQLVVDLASLASVREAASRAERLGALHLLVNNAGVMGTPRTATAEGYELQLATNHLGPFLLTGLLWPQLVAGGAEQDDRPARVVAVASQFHRIARRAPRVLPLDRTPGRYAKWRSYAESKTANLLTTFELDRRAGAAGAPVLGLAAHPGFAGTHLAANGQYGRSSGGIASILDAAVRAVSQSAAAGALPVLMAATADLPGGSYCGPDGPAEFAGAPQVVTASRLAQDADVATALWAASEDAVGVSFP